MSLSLHERKTPTKKPNVNSVGDEPGFSVVPALERAHHRGCPQAVGTPVPDQRLHPDHRTSCADELSRHGRDASAQTVATLRVDEEVDAVFACTRKERQITRTGSPYLNVELRDSTGSIAGRAFRDADVLARLGSGATGARGR